MKSALNSATAKAAVAKANQKASKAEKLQAASPLKLKRDIRGFWAQYPKTRDLFGAIMTKWRASSSRRPGYDGYWAAYPYPEWTALTGLKESTLKRHLNQLEQHGLIQRTHGRHGGTRQLTFIRPTALAFTLSDTKESDWKRIGIDPDKPKAMLKHTPPPVLSTFAEDNDPPIQSKAELLAIINGKA